MSKFPNLLAAATAREKRMKQVDGSDLWAIGAAVIKDCGGAKVFNAVGPGLHTGTTALLAEASAELARHGCKNYTATYLAKIANTSIAFPVSRRYEDLSFAIHYEARNPDLLDWVVKKVGGDDITSEVARYWVSHWDTMQTEKRRREYEAAAEVAKQAVTPQAKRKAEEKMRDLGRPMPKVNLDPPTRKEEGALVEMIGFLEIGLDAGHMITTLRKNLAALRDLPVNPDMTDAMADDYRKVAEIATQIFDLLSKTKKGRLTVVGGAA